MSRYLEEAADLLRKSADANEYYRCPLTGRTDEHRKTEGRERIAREFAALAAIDKGLLPAELTETVLDAIRKAGGR
ncbi:hypothetical protein [Streptomyces reniochalinae]|uniref:Uncharacterized protein n=1 Tax=Streptomyces reniochalinae TaxID=2250578 RepID=A0A367EVV8_9ACTN|nr:hypothetical protein [Streptomyces reniochalinae]RCG21772.1 hypothetical protein DQ392_08675 [Streptomyces reniochalinae]